MTLDSRSLLAAKQRGEATPALGPLLVLAVLICVWFPFQDLVLAFLYGRGAPGAAIRGLLLLKEALVVLIVGLALLRWTLGSELRVVGADLLALLYAAVITAYLPVGDAELQPRLAQYRSLILPALLYFCGRALPATHRALHAWILWTAGLAVGLSALGIVERFALGAEFWRSTVPLGSYLDEIKGQTLHLVENLPGNMFGDYGFGYFQFRRLSGPFGSPLTMGYYLVFPVVLMICLLLGRGLAAAGPEAAEAQALPAPERRLRGSLLLAGIAVCSLALALTVTRAGVGAVAVAVALALPLYRQVRLIVVAALLGFGLFILFEQYLGLILEATLTMNDSSMRGHYLFLMNSLDVVMEYPLGLGMGTAGGWAHTMSDRFSGAAENAFLVIVAQAGVYAALLFVLFCAAALARLRRAERDAGGPLQLGFFRAVFLSTIGYLITGLMSEQILTFTSVAHFWMSLGYAVTLACDHEASSSEFRVPSSELGAPGSEFGAPPPARPLPEEHSPGIEPKAETR